MLKNQPVKFLILEMVFIIFGVIIGLLGNELRQDRSDKAQAEEAMQYIEKELEKNFSQIDTLITYHRELRTSLEKLTNRVFNEKEDISYTDLFNSISKGFMIPLMDLTGWDLAKATGAVNHFNYEVAAKLSRLYFMQKHFTEHQLGKIAENWYLASNNNPENINGLVISFFFIANDIVMHEMDMKKEYMSFLEMISEYKS